MMESFNDMLRVIIISALLFGAINLGLLTGEQALWAVGIGIGLFAVLIIACLILAWAIRDK